MVVIVGFSGGAAHGRRQRSVLHFTNLRLLRRPVSSAIRHGSIAAPDRERADAVADCWVLDDFAREEQVKMGITRRQFSIALAGAAYLRLTGGVVQL